MKSPRPLRRSRLSPRSASRRQARLLAMPGASPERHPGGPCTAAARRAALQHRRHSRTSSRLGRPSPASRRAGKPFRTRPLRRALLSVCSPPVRRLSDRSKRSLRSLAGRLLHFGTFSAPLSTLAMNEHRSCLLDIAGASRDLAGKLQTARSRGPVLEYAVGGASCILRPAAVPFALTSLTHRPSCSRLMDPRAPREGPLAQAGDRDLRADGSLPVRAPPLQPLLRRLAYTPRRDRIRIMPLVPTADWVRTPRATLEDLVLADQAEVEVAAVLPPCRLLSCTPFSS